MSRLKKAIQLYVEAELYDYPYTKQQIDELRADIAESGVTLEQALLGAKIQANRHSDPTQNKGIELATNRRLTRMIQTVQAIEAVLPRLRSDLRKMVQMRYFEREYTDQAIAYRLHINERTLRRWRRDVAWMIAVELGLVNATEVSA